MTSGGLSDVSALPGRTRRRRRWPAITALIAVALVCLAIAIAAGLGADADATRKPTAAQRAAAAATAVADRWRTWKAGQILPASLRYSTSLLTNETAARVAIAPQIGCATALDPAVVALATQNQCRAVLRATYADQLQGVLYTIGVVAFPTTRLAAHFAAGITASSSSKFALQAFAMPGTASALFSSRSRQSATARQAGPFVVLSVAGYADGEPAGAGQESRPADFAPATQLTAAIASLLETPVVVTCKAPQWSC